MQPDSIRLKQSLASRFKGIFCRFELLEPLFAVMVAEGCIGAVGGS
jgi:hypothetical protein